MKEKMWKRDFSLVIIGQIISIMGSAILRFALDLYILDITGRADIFAAVVAISAIPVVILSPIGGAVADRFNRRNLMVIFDFLSSTIVLLLFFFLLKGNTGVPVIGTAMVLLAVVSAVYQPTVQASIPVLVAEENLAQANGIVNGVGALSSLMGPILGSVLYGFWGLRVLIVVSCIAFFLSAVMEMFIRIPFKKPEQKGYIVAAIWDDMKNGAYYMIKKNTYILKVIGLAALLNMLMSPLFIIGVPYILRVTMKSSDLMYGMSMGIIQISSIIGALSIGIFCKKMSMNTLYKWLLATAVFLLPMAFALIPQMLSRGFWPAFIIFFFFGFIIMMMLTVISVFVITAVQKETPNEMLGKVMAIVMAVSQCAAPLGQLLYGGLFKIFSQSVYVPVLLAAAFTFIISIVGKKLLRMPDKA